MLAGWRDAVSTNEMVQALKGQCVLSVLNLSPRKLGSIEEYLGCLSSTLTRCGGKSVLAVCTPPSDDVREVFDRAGAVIEILPFSAGDAAVAAALAPLLVKYSPDSVHIHFVPLASPIVKAAGQTEAKVFVSHHTSIEPGDGSSFIRSIVNKIRYAGAWKHVHRFVGPSEYIRQYLIRELHIPAEQVVAIHNGVNLDRHRPGKAEPIDIREKYGIPANEKIVIHIAYAHKYKGIDDFVRAATVVKVHNFPFRFLVVGDGERMAEYKALAEGLGIADNVTFTGLADGTMVNSLLAQCDLTTLACTWGEAFSLVVLESMARGKAMVATAVGGTPEAITSGETGLLVSPWDWRSLGESIAHLLEDDGLRTRLGEAARERTEKLFNIERWVRRTLALYATNNPDAWECLHSGTQDRDSVVG